MHLKFDQIFKISMDCLKLIGAHSAVKRDLRWLLHFTLMHGYFLIMWGYFAHNIIFVDRDILVACGHGVFVVVVVVVTFMYGVLLWYQDNINILLATQQHFFDLASELSESDQMIVYDYAKRGRFVSKLWLASTLVTLFMFPIKGAIDTAISAFAHGEFVLYPLCETSYPFGINEIKERVDVFIIIYTMNLITAAYSLLMYVGFSPLGPILILNACAQIELVTGQVNMLFTPEKQNSHEIRRKIKKIVLDLDKIYEFVQEINIVFQVIYELSLKASAIMIPVSVYLILESLNRGLLSIEYIMFAYAASLLCFLPCYYSDLLMEKSEELRLALYSNGWQNDYDKSIRQSVLILLIRTTRPISISSVFSVVCLDTFAELCHQAYAIFNLMNAGPGVCYRVYSEKQYADMEPFSTPEVSRVPLASLLLLMSALGVSDVRRFPFVDTPPEHAVENALLELKQHGALTSNEKLTALGRSLSNLPVEVSLAKALVVGSATLPPHKRDSALALAAALGIRSIFTTRAHRDFECENARKPDESDHGDPLTLLSLYCAWLSEKARGGGRAWCRRRGVEEQRLYELTKLAAQLRSLLQDNNLMETPEPESMSSAERSQRHGQIKQLRDMRRQYKQKAAEDTKRKKRLKINTWEIVDETADDDDSLDIRDIEFRMTNDASRIHALINGASASSGRDLITLKVVLCRALYPQLAVADEFNHCKSVSEQLFHTWSKPFVFLHPTSYFGKQARILQLSDTDIQTDLPAGYKSKLAVSAKHQMLCYLSLFETTKPYIVNSMRMPAAQTLLLLAHAIDTNIGFTRIVCDSWLLLEFPFPETGLNLLMKATKLRQRWDALINQRLTDANPTKSVESELENAKKPTKINYEQLQHDLSCDISSYMTSEVYYTLKRLLPGDLKVLYYGADEAHPIIDPNPFEEGFECHVHEKKGGVYVTDNIVYNCLVDTDWSYNSYQEAYNIPWTCQNCQISVCLSPLEKLQHTQFTCSSKVEVKQETPTATRENRPNDKEYKCENCEETLYMTSVEILKHKKSCQKK